MIWFNMRLNRLLATAVRIAVTLIATAGITSVGIAAVRITVGIVDGDAKRTFIA